MSKILFKSIKWKNFLGFGNYWSEINLDTKTVTIISGKNGFGKCLRKSTKIDVEISDKQTQREFEKFLNSKKD